MNSEKRKCCGNCVHLTPEGECDYCFDQIPDEDVFDTYCDAWKED